MYIVSMTPVLQDLSRKPLLITDNPLTSVERGSFERMSSQWKVNNPRQSFFSFLSFLFKLDQRMPTI